MSGHTYHVSATVDDADVAEELSDQLHGDREVGGSISDGKSVTASLGDRGAAKDLAWRWLNRSGVTGVSLVVEPVWTWVR